MTHRWVFNDDLVKELPKILKDVDLSTPDLNNRHALAAILWCEGTIFRDTFDARSYVAMANKNGLSVRNLWRILLIRTSAGDKRASLMRYKIQKYLNSLEDGNGDRVRESVNKKFEAYYKPKQEPVLPLDQQDIPWLKDDDDD